jgi:hypothetical protein
VLQLKINSFMAIQIENARREEKEAVIKLLKQGDLPTDDLPVNLPDFVIAKEHDTYVGVAGLERFGSVGLLRSVAVDLQHQGRQIAGDLVEQLLERDPGPAPRSIDDVIAIDQDARAWARQVIEEASA